MQVALNVVGRCSWQRATGHPRPLVHTPCA